MSIASRLSALFRSAARSPEVRRAAQGLAKEAGRRLSGRSGASARGTGESSRERTGTLPADRRPSPARRPVPRASSTSRSPRGAGSADGDGAHLALADRSGGALPELRYAPVDDDLADPGEIVWAWVAFEEDISRGKDRPVLVIAREDARDGGTDGSGPVAVALMLTSHDRGTGTHTDEHGTTWVDIGSGPWDSRGRPSEVRVDRLLRIPLGAVRREGARLDARRFEVVVGEVRRARR